MADPFVEVFGPLATLRDRVKAVFAAHGLNAEHIGFEPGPSTEGPHEVQVLVTLGPLPEEREADEAFEQVLRDARQAEVETRANAALDELRDNLRGGKGFLDDPSGDA